MKIFLVGVSCVGKTTIGRHLAERLSCVFFDFDKEIENYFRMPISRIKARYLTEYSFRAESSKALKLLIDKNKAKDYVVAMPPSGLMDSYWRILKKTDCLIIALKDRPENILERLTFYDNDSNPIDKKPSARERPLYLREIKKDITYFGKSYSRAHLTVYIDGAGVEGSVDKILEAIAGGVHSKHDSSVQTTDH